MITGKSKRQSIRDSWNTSEYRYVCYIDIMGFKNLVERSSHERIYKMMMKVSEALNNTESAFSTNQQGELSDVNITMTTYSDSIIIYSKNNDQENQSNFLAAVGSFAEDLFLAEIPYRGSVAYGMMTVDFKNSIFFGRPLIDAYQLSEELCYYGVVVHASAEWRKGFRESNAVIEYACPFKSGIAKHLTVIPSIDVVSKYTSLNNSVNLLKKKTSGGLRKYIDNTEAYLEWVFKMRSGKTRFK